MESKIIMITREIKCLSCGNIFTIAIEDIIVFIDAELYDEGENLKVKKIVKKDEIAYTTSRFFEGQDAKDDGFSCYIDFFAFKNYKKGHGKCTSYTVELERFNDE